MKISSISNLSCNRKTNFSNFNKELFKKDKQNEVLFAFIYCILHTKNNTLSKIYEYIEE